MWKIMWEKIATKLADLPVKFVNLFNQMFVLVESAFAGLTRMVANPLGVIKILVIALFAYDITIKNAEMTGKFLTKIQEFTIAVASNIAKFGWEMLIFGLIIVIILKADKLKK